LVGVFPLANHRDVAGTRASFGNCKEENSMRLGTASLLVVLLLVAGFAGAQVQRGSIAGTVYDPSGYVVTGAKVVVTDTATSAVFTAKASAEGTFTVSGLPFGSYAVTVVAPGFSKWETRGIEVVTAQETDIRVALRVGTAEEAITVEASAAEAPIETTSTELSTHVDRRQVVDLPTQTRNPFDFATQMAGVTATGGATSANSVMNGLRGSSNNLTQDGINLQDTFIKTSGFGTNFGYIPALEGTGEFSITGQNLGAESGDGVVQVRLTTDRGTNQLHGGLFYFGRNDFFNANTWLNDAHGTPRSALHQHRFGGRVGGPVRIPKLYNGKDRTFFFFEYSAFREHFQNTEDNAVLTADARNGIFKYVGSSGAVQAVNLLNLSSRTLGGNSFTQQLINATPLPVATSNITIDPLRGDGINSLGARFKVPVSDPNNQYDLRVDQKLFQSQNWGTHWLEGDWHWFRSPTTPGTDPPFPQGISPNCFAAVCNTSENTVSEYKLLAVAVNSTLGATMTNEFRVGVSRPHITFVPPTPFPRPFKVNFAGSNLMFNPEDNFDPQGRLSPYFAFIDNFTKLKGTHTFKTGFLISSASVHRFNDFAGNTVAGGVVPQVTLGASPINGDGLSNCTSFPDLPNGNAGTVICNNASNLYANLVGLVNNTSQTFNAIPGQGFIPGLSDVLFLRERSYNVYFSDSWRIRPKLTLNYGLRYEIVPAVDIVNKRGLVPSNELGDVTPFGPVFQPNPSVTFTTLKANLNTSTQLVPGGASNGKPFWNTDWKNFAPSAGFAWEPFSKTVVRGGYAISYVRDTLTIVSNVLTGNLGLHAGSAISPAQGDPLAVLNSNVSQVLPTPALVLPQLQVNNFLNGFSSGGTPPGFEAFDPNLRTPYVQQWTLGVERELSHTTALEVRYVGNHSTELYRGNDFNQVNLTPALVAEFNQAIANFNICAANRKACTGSATGNLRFDNRGLSGQGPTPVLTAMNFPLFTSSSLATLLQQGQAGQFWFLAQSNCTFRFLSGTGCAGLGAFPANFFVANPLGGPASVFGNGADANYQGLQTEIRRRLSGGLQLQGNYTFAKVLTDSSGSSQSEFDSSLDLHNPRFNRSRASFDIRHTVHMNGIWEFPLGRGRRWLAGGVLGKILEGWQAGSLWTWRSGVPLSIVSARGTVNRSGNSGTNPAVAVGGLTDQQVCNALGVFKVPGQGAFLVPANFISANGTANSSVFSNPAAGSLGDADLRNACSGPSFNQIDMNFVKRTKITEKVNFEFRTEFFNIFNHPNFSPSTTNSINSTQFGTITNVFTPREIQFNGRINF
jgi:hypothetical protein